MTCETWKSIAAGMIGGTIWIIVKETYIAVRRIFR